ncbi:response regulator [Aquabacterium sp.]|uniref:response regulator n=1 Tax=Aquabacterium sp. TaxID=1872578 RepID=UPI0035B1EF1D
MTNEVPHPIRVLIADDHALVCIALRLTLELEGRYVIVGEARDGDEALALAAASRPQVVVLDPGMPGLSHERVIRDIKAGWPDVKVVVLTANLDPEATRRSLAAGADAYVVKADEPVELLHALSVVLEGGCHISASLASALHMPDQALPAAPDPQDDGSTPAGGAAPDLGPRLTVRELEVLKLVGAGHSNTQVSVLLGISVGTVRKHRENLMRKLGLHNVAQLTAYGIKAGLLVS